MASSTLLSALLSTGAIAFTFYLTHNLISSVAIGCALKLGVYAFVSRITVASSEEKRIQVPPWSMAKETMNKGLLLSISAFAVSLGVSVPVLVLGNTHDSASVGAYSSIYNVSAVSNILFGAVSQAELRGFAKLAAQSRFNEFIQRARRFSVGLSIIGILGAIVLFFWGPQIFGVIFGQDFSDHRTALVAMGLTITIAPFGFFLDIQLTALQRFSIQTKISIATLAFTALCGILLVPYFAILGATITVLLTMLLRNIWKSFVVRKVIAENT